MSESIGPAASRTSTWATASFLCSIAICCPAMSVVAILLGVRAMVELKANPLLRGNGLAKLGIGLGALMTVAWIAAFIWWHFNARVPMLHGPRDEIVALQSGDVARFQQGFTGEGATAEVSKASAFGQELMRRYGRLRDVAQSQHPSTTASMSGTAALPISYSFAFELASVEGEGTFVTFGESRGIPKLIFKWRSVRFIDAERGDLVYP